MEPVARHSALLVRRGAPAQRRRRPGQCLVRRVIRCGSRSEQPGVIVVSESELAVLAMDGGRWAEAAGRVEAALSVVDKARMHDYATSVLAFAAAARLAVHRGDMEGANRELTRAMRARPTLTFVFPYLAVRLRLQLAKGYWAIADYSAARHLLREIDDIMLHRPRPRRPRTGGLGVPPDRNRTRTGTGRGSP